MSKYSYHQASKKLTKKYGQQKYCKSLIHCECLGDGIHSMKRGIKYSKLYSNVSRLLLKQIKLLEVQFTLKLMCECIQLIFTFLLLRENQSWTVLHRQMPM